MTSFLRRAGAGLLADGSTLVWSVADGRRGRRWRAVATREGAITHALLLEVDVAGRPGKIELATPAGLLTLHPEEGRGQLHGNVVTAEGVRHLTLAWSGEHGLEVEGRPIGSAVTAHRLARSTRVGEGRAVPVVVIGSQLSVVEAARRYTRTGEGEWRVESASDATGPWILRIDPRGVPRLPGDEREWPLELD